LPITLNEEETRCVVRLQGDVDAADSGQLKGALVEAIAARKELHVEFAEATDLDVTAVQLLWAAKHAAGQANTSWTAEGIPEPILMALRETGFENFLGAMRAGAAPAIPANEAAASEDDRQV
jgi:anti-anti-sigma regulatory factor